MHASWLAFKNVCYIIFYENLALENIHYQKLAKIIGNKFLDFNKQCKMI